MVITVVQEEVRTDFTPTLTLGEVTRQTRRGRHMGSLLVRGIFTWTEFRDRTLQGYVLVNV